jgi:hypothetical protein
MENKKKKEKIPEYFPKSSDPINTLLLYFPTKHVKALKVSIVILFILIPVLIIMIILDFKWLLPLLLILFGLLFITIIIYKGAIVITIILCITLFIWWFFLGLIIYWTEPSGFSTFMKFTRIPILILNVLFLIYFYY